MARDCYHDCIAFLDDQLGRLLDELQGRGLLGNTDVIITSDHGEEFGEHLFFGHAHNTNLDAIGVPLVILSPRAPGGPGGVQPCQPARPAGDRGRPAGPLGRLAVPGPLVDGLLGARDPGSTRRSPAPPSPSRPRPPHSNPSRQAVASTQDSRCPSWPRAIIT